MSSQSGQSERLQLQVNPFIRTLPGDVLFDVMGSVISAYWSNLLAEGRTIPTVMTNLTGMPAGPELDALVTRVLFNDFRNRCLTHAWRISGLESVKNMIICPDAERIREMHRSRQPAVFVFSHFGPKYAIAPAFQNIDVPVAMFQGIIPQPLTKEDVEKFAAKLPGMEYYWINDQTVNRALHLKRAVERLQKGGLVATAIDGGHGDVLTEAEFFGHKIQVARGPAVLARMTGAPLIPVTVTWSEGWGMEFRVHEPIARPQTIPANSGEFDLAMTNSAMRFFDQFIRSSPEQLRLDRVARLITMPRAEP